VVHPAPRKILESIGDQENIPLDSTGKAAVLEPDSTSFGGIKTNAAMGKRLSAASGNNAPTKKPKVPRTTRQPKVVPLQKGQKKLSAFFRV